MHHQGCLTRPRAHEAQQIADVLLGRHHIAVDVLVDVVHVEQQMIFRRDARGPVHQRDVLDQGHDMPRTAVAHGVVEAGEGTDVNHYRLMVRPVSYSLFSESANRLR
jgi:hypothetical protein